MANGSNGLDWLTTDLPRILEGLTERQERMEQVQRAFQVEIREKLDNIEMRLPPAILSRKQAAKLLKVHVRTVDAALDSGKLREVRIEGGKGRFVDATSLRGVNVAAEIDRIKRGIYTTR